MSADVSFNSGAKRRTRKVPLTVMVAGAAGTGKSALVDALVGRRVRRDESTLVTPADSPLRITQHQLDEDPDFVPVLLDVCNSAAIDAEEDIERLTHYLETRFDEMVSEQSRIRRNPRFEDRRVHACIYLLHAPHGLCEFDLVSMTRLSTLTAVIPVLAGAEALTQEELAETKLKVRMDCAHYKIPTFDLEGLPQPLHITRTNEYDRQGNALLTLRLAYGRLDATDPAISDFNPLRAAVFGSFGFDLIDHTVDILYEQYRTIRLSDPTARYSVLEPEALAGHATRLKQEMLERESRELRENEDRIKRELEQRRLEILEREQALRKLEKQLEEERQAKQSALETHQLAQRNALLEAERNNSTSFHETEALEEEDEEELSTKNILSPPKPTVAPPPLPQQDPERATGSAKTGPPILKPNPISTGSGSAKTGPLLRPMPKSPNTSIGQFEAGNALNISNHPDILPPPPRMTANGPSAPASPASSNSSGSSSPKLGRKISFSSLGAAASAAKASVTSRLKKPQAEESAPPSPQSLPLRSLVSLPVARNSAEESFSSSSSALATPEAPTFAASSPHTIHPPARPTMSEKRPPSYVDEGLVSRNSFNRKPSNAREPTRMPSTDSLPPVGVLYEAKYNHSGSSLGSEGLRGSPSLPPRSPNRPSSFVSLDGTLSRTRSIPDRTSAVAPAKLSHLSRPARADSQN